MQVVVAPNAMTGQSAATIPHEQCCCGNQQEREWNPEGNDELAGPRRMLAEPRKQFKLRTTEPLMDRIEPGKGRVIKPKLAGFPDPGSQRSFVQDSRWVHVPNEHAVYNNPAAFKVHPPMTSVVVRPTKGRVPA